jgi:hypothetical protein
VSGDAEEQAREEAREQAAQLARDAERARTEELALVRHFILDVTSWEDLSILELLVDQVGFQLADLSKRKKDGSQKEKEALLKEMTELPKVKPDQWRRHLYEALTAFNQFIFRVNH